MAKRRQFGSLSKAARDRAARTGRNYGLSRRQVRERYNRGTFSPFARDPASRIPTEYRRYVGDGGVIDWRDAALDNMRRVFENYFKYNDDAVVYYTQRMDQAVAYMVAKATEDELLQWASVQPDSDGNPPSIEAWVNLPPDINIEDVSAYVDGKWNNIFWYH